MKQILSLLILSFSILGNTVYSQQNFWKSISKNNKNHLSEELIQRKHSPTKSIQLDLAYQNFVNYLKNTKDSSILLKFPNDSGAYNTFKIVETTNLSKELQIKYPNIKSFSGYNIKNTSEKINFSISPEFGLYASINNGTRNILIDTYSKNKSSYIIYDKNNLINDDSKFKCEIDEDESGLGLDNLNLKEINKIQNRANDGYLKKFRLAITTTKEYSNYIIQQAGLENSSIDHKKAAILAAVNISLTRINEILKNDVGIFLELIPNTDQLFFIDHDNFNIYNSSELLDNNIIITNNIIGVDNYDIGHLFFQVSDNQYSNGLAWTPAVCNDYKKAGGITGTFSPVGDAFDIDYTAHEIGHQLGASHTQNNNCNRSRRSSVETGSGSTIMAYTGICAPNVQQNSDAYYHTKSIEEIHSTLDYIRCGENIKTNNIAPLFTSRLANSYSIPVSTAFALEATANDPNNDQLTYSWEQMNFLKSNITPPISTNTQGPNFRSFPPTIESIRYFPKLEKIINNQLVFESNPYFSATYDYNQNNWEIIPSVARKMNFSVTVRDNNNEVGLTARQNVEVNFINVEPFRITSQQTNEKWIENSQQTITWDVGATNSYPINTINVKILLSLDGGKNFNITLADSVPNNGSYSFTVSKKLGVTNNARIMIKAIDNIFLAINSANFSIENSLSPASYTNTNNKTLNIYPNPSNGVININYITPISKGKISVNDLTGKVVYSDNLTNTKSQKINLSHLSNGLYILSVEYNGEKITQKIIIKK